MLRLTIRSSQDCGVDRGTDIQINGTQKKTHKQTNKSAQLISDKDAKATQWRRDFFSKWCCSSCISIGKNKQKNSNLYKS